MTFREGCSKAAAIRRELGWWVLFWRVLGALGIRRVVLYRRGPASYRAPQVPVEFGPMREDEVAEYLDLRPDTDPAEVEARFARGDVCHVARSDGRIVAARWSSTREIRIADLGYSSPLEESSVYMYDAYTSPPFRRLGIGAAMSRRLVDRFHRQGMEVYGSAEPANLGGRALNRDAVPVTDVLVIGRRRRWTVALPARRSGR